MNLGKQGFNSEHHHDIYPGCNLFGCSHHWQATFRRPLREDFLSRREGVTIKQSDSGANLSFVTAVSRLAKRAPDSRTFQLILMQYSRPAFILLDLQFLFTCEAGTNKPCQMRHVK
jgi:hypothetical protein